MSNYLDNLIAKTLGLADVVQPRPVSPFEPVRQDAFVADNVVRDRPTDQPAPFTVPDTIASTATHRSMEPVREPAIILFNEAVAEAREGTQKRIPAGAAQAPGPVLNNDDGRVLSENTGIARPDTVPAPEVGRAPEAPSGVVHVSMLQPPPPQPAAPSFAPAPPQVSIPREPVLDAALPSETLLVAPSGRPEPPAPDFKHSKASREPGRETPPAIKITIGRVEVRAVMPEAPQPKPSPTPRTVPLSLEEYLRQRSGGQR
jgi:hypothetical protein